MMPLTTLNSGLISTCDDDDDDERMNFNVA